MNVSALTLMTALLFATLMPKTALARQIYRDETSFLAALDERTVEGFESFPTEHCPSGELHPRPPFKRMRSPSALALSTEAPLFSVWARLASWTQGQPRAITH
jgi:hypothetical protein